MFAKPYKLKSANALKNSEKKHLAQRILEEFRTATEEQVKELVPVKSSSICLKLVLHSGEIVSVYSVDNVPMIIETETGLVPTVCALWKAPDLVPSLTIHSPVLGKILGGAPLYLPGVVIPPGGTGFPQFSKGAVISAHTADNCAAGVVGRAAIGSGDMLMRTAGICLETIHVYGDQLCREPKFSKIERPRFSAVSHALEADQLATGVGQLSINQSAQCPNQLGKEEWPSLGRPKSAPTAVPQPDAPQPAETLPEPRAPNEPKVIPDETQQEVADVLNDSINSDTMEPDENAIPEDMDGLLRWTVLCWLRLQGKNVELPLKTNLLYRNHLFPLCPSDRTLDVKKSTYKKMGKFLEAMQREGLLEVKEIEKGVAAVVSVNVSHPAVRATRVPAALKEHIQQAKEGEKEKEDYEPPVVREMLCVTAAVQSLFPDVKKGTALTPSEVRGRLTEYVKGRQLPQLQGSVALDAALASVTGKREQELLKWDALMSGVCGRMTLATELRWRGGETRLIRSRLEPVSMSVAQRSGNKKVTLVNNLEAYGFYLPSLSTVCQHGVGASCGVTRSPGAKHDQLMLQGDQTHFVAKLLIEKYGLPKKFVEGADKALNKKK